MASRSTCRAALWLGLLAAGLCLWAFAARPGPRPAPVPRAPAAPADGAPAPPPAGGDGADPAPGEAPPDSPAGLRAPEELEVRVFRDGSVEIDGGIVDLDGLRAVLERHADRLREEDQPLRPSGQGVLLLAQARTPWNSVLSVIRELTGPDVRLWRLRIGILGEDLPLELPLRGVLTGAGRRWITLDGPVEVGVRLTRTGAGEGTRIVLMDRPMGEGEEGFASLASALETLHGADDSLRGLVSAGPDVPVEDVLRLLCAFARAGFDPPRIEGAPPECPEAEELLRAAESLESGELLERCRAGLASRDGRVREAARDVLAGRGEAAVPILVDAMPGASERIDLPSLLRALLALTDADGRPVDLRPALAAIRAAVLAHDRGWDQLAAMEDRLGEPRTPRPDPPEAGEPR